MNIFKKRALENQSERLNELYEDILTVLEHAPTLDECTDEESEMYATAFELKDRIKEAGYSKKELRNG